MWKIFIGAVVLVAVAVAVIVGFYAWGGYSHYTECYGIFSSRDAAERAADAAGSADLDAEVDHRHSRFSVTFDTGETGSDAAEARRAFREIVRREGGKLGHPGGGCTERTPLD